jgi:uncharacterized protein YjbI with pentapeptide repeats
MDPRVQAQVWSRLCSYGVDLADLNLPIRQGRIDLSGLNAPSQVLGISVETPYGTVQQIERQTVVKGTAWRSLDFTGCSLPSLSFSDVEIEDCVLDLADCSGWRLWDCAVRNSSFKGANLKEAVLGGRGDRRRNQFQSINFVKADLRKTVYFCGEFVNCDFERAKLRNVEFFGCTFESCHFAGAIQNVLFYKSAYDCKRCPVNEMMNVDMIDAELKHVEFRGLDLDKVRLPLNEAHIVIPDYKETLQRAIAAYQNHESASFRSLSAYLECMLEWAGPNQRSGILHRDSMNRLVGSQVFDDFVNRCVQAQEGM